MRCDVLKIEYSMVEMTTFQLDYAEKRDFYNKYFNIPLDHVTTLTTYLAKYRNDPVLAGFNLNV